MNQTHDECRSQIENMVLFKLVAEILPEIVESVYKIAIDELHCYSVTQKWEPHIRMRYELLTPYTLQKHTPVHVNVCICEIEGSWKQMRQLAGALTILTAIYGSTAFCVKEIAHYGNRYVNYQSGYRQNITTLDEMYIELVRVYVRFGAVLNEKYHAFALAPDYISPL